MTITIHQKIKLNNQEASIYLRGILESYKKLVDAKKDIFIKNVYTEISNVNWQKPSCCIDNETGKKSRILLPMTKEDKLKLINSSDNLLQITLCIYNEKYIRKAPAGEYVDTMRDYVVNCDNGNEFIQLDPLEDLIYGTSRNEFDSKLYDQIKAELVEYYEDDEAWIKSAEDYYTFLSQYIDNKENNLFEFKYIANLTTYLEDMLKTESLDKELLINSLGLK